jgi:hypothetical protein
MAQQTKRGLYGGPRRLYGSFAGRVDTTPDAFSFTDVSDQALSTLITSNTITVTGLGAAAAVTFIETGHTSGEYSRNGGAWTDLAGFDIDNDDTLQLRLTSSGNNSEEFDIQVTIGGVSDTWAVSTLAEVVEEAETNSGGFLSLAERQLIQAQQDDEEALKVIYAFLEAA